MPGLIEDYGMIGDCETAALVGRDGSMDWLCLPRFDSDACFAALLGSPENGYWKITPRDSARATRRYREDTLILETEFRTPGGRATLIDFMPIRESSPRIVRILRGDRGTVAVRMTLVIRFDYGLTVPWVTRARDRSLMAIAGPNRLTFRSSVPVHGEGLKTVSNFTVTAGQTVRFELQHSKSYQRMPRHDGAHISLKRTEKWWKEWIGQCKYKGPSSAAVRRSLIVLKALTHARTGGMVAAPTTSLPERPHGSWNWDYRYCWVRDATFTLLGFVHAGFHEEARQWKDWLVRSIAGSPNQIQIMYGPAGERLLREWEVPWLKGYRGAKPVRVGNKASEQLQLDIYGEIADVLHQALISADDGAGNFDLQAGLLGHLCKIWQRPDHGIWELRGAPRHYTHSKVMAWVAFDRTIRTAERFKLRFPIEEWRAVRRKIHENVCRFGFNRRLNSFVRSYGSPIVDASLLLIPIVGFLPARDPRVVGTVRLIEKRLLLDGLVMRHDRSRSAGFTSRSEGAFLPCSFWLADYYQLAGRPSAAQRLLERLLRVQNDLGLLAEEYDVRRKQAAGNFPQALAHVALVNTVINHYAPRGPVHQRAEPQRDLT